MVYPKKPLFMTLAAMVLKLYLIAHHLLIVIYIVTANHQFRNNVICSNVLVSTEAHVWINKTNLMRRLQLFFFLQANLQGRTSVTAHRKSCPSVADDSIF